MKKTILFGLIFMTMLVLFTGCFEPPAHVRFVNVMTDGTYVMYGLRCGTAEYIGSLYPNSYTSYYESTPGTFPMQIRSVNGTWVDLSSMSFRLEGGKYYSLTLEGTSSYLYTYLYED